MMGIAIPHTHTHTHTRTSHARTHLDTPVSARGAPLPPPPAFRLLSRAAIAELELPPPPENGLNRRFGALQTGHLKLDASLPNAASLPS